MEPPKRFIERIFKFCVMLALSAFLLRLAARWVIEAAPYLLVLFIIVLAGTIAYRVWRHMRDMGKW